MVSRRGYSLIEVLVALAVLGIGAAGAAASATLALRVAARASAEETSARIAAEVLDSLLQHPAPVPGQSVRGLYVVGWSTGVIDRLRIVEVTVHPPHGAVPDWSIAGVHHHLPRVDGDEP